MNKSAGVLLGLVVAIGAVSVGGAWYTGTKVEGVLNTALQNANQELNKSLAGAGGSGSIELVSLDRQLFSSTAHYRVKLENLQVGEQSKSFELLFVDRIEHGPLPWSRLKALKLMPVMVNSNYALEKNEFTAKWFDAAKGEAPLKGQAALGYNHSVDGNIELVPLDFAPDPRSSLKFSGLNLAISATDKAAELKVNGYMDSFKFSTISEREEPVQVEFNGLTLASDLSKSPFDFYLGQNLIELSSVLVNVGQNQSFSLKGFEQKDSMQATGNSLAGHLAYKVDAMAYNDKPIGSAKMSWSAKNLDIPSAQVLVQMYQTQMQAMQKAGLEAGAPGAVLPDFTAAQQVEAEAAIKTLLAGKPQIALENLSLKTANGESRFSLLVDLTNPSSTDLPPLELAKQGIAQLDAKLSLSKPMIGDLAALQAQVEGQTDAQAIAQQAAMSGEMAGTLAVSTALATVEGNDILSKLHYANGEVEFNGQKMPVEAFAEFVMSRLGAMGGAH